MESKISSTEGPCITRILGLQKNRVTQNLHSASNWMPILFGSQKTLCYATHHNLRATYIFRGPDTQSSHQFFMPMSGRTVRFIWPTSIAVEYTRKKTRDAFFCLQQPTQTEKGVQEILQTEEGGQWPTQIEEGLQYPIQIVRCAVTNRDGKCVQ